MMQILLYVALSMVFLDSTRVWLSCPAKCTWDCVYMHMCLSIYICTVFVCMYICSGVHVCIKVLYIYCIYP